MSTLRKAAHLAAALALMSAVGLLAGAGLLFRSVGDEL